MTPPSAPPVHVPLADLSREHAQALAEKLSVLIPLCVRREELLGAGHARVPPEESEARKRVMAELAARFPGALRELDGASAALLTQRAQLLAQWLDAGAPPPPPPQLRWAAAQHLVHQHLKQQLEARRAGQPASPRPMADLALEHAASLLGLSFRETKSLVYPKA